MGCGNHLNELGRAIETSTLKSKAEFRKLYGIKRLKPLGFNNAYALMMRRPQARELHIETISDLKKYY